MFADDTSLTLSGPNFDDIVTNLTNELLNVRNYMLRNRLSVNLDKTFGIVFSNRPFDRDQLLQLKLDDRMLNVFDRCKYLGLTIDNSLNFSSHINNISKKISKTVGIMFRLRSSVPDHILLNLYYTLIYPYLTYCNIIWGGASEVHLRNLKLLQKKAVRLITNSNYLAHTNPLYVKTNILKINDIHTYLLAVQGFKSRHIYNNTPHEYDTRNRDNLIPEFQRLSSSQNSISYTVPTVWNNLPTYVKQCQSLPLFKSQLRRHLINAYVD